MFVGKFGQKSGWCGSTLISSRWILPAGYCTDGADGVTIYLAIKSNNEKGQQRYYSSKSNIVLHADWDASTLSNDISLSAEIEFNDRIQPASLPKKGGQYSDCGWGRDSDSAISVSPFLRYIKGPFLKQNTCRTYYIGMVSENMICISGKGGKSTCNGDSGGPLVHKDGGVNYVIGDTSFGISIGCEKGWPGIFTHLTSYLDWIEKISGVANK